MGPCAAAAPDVPTDSRTRSGAAAVRARVGYGKRRGGFSLIELVIVVVIIGIIAAIAIPRMSRGTEGTKEPTFIRNLNTLRQAIDLYHAEHGQFPTAGGVEAQLTQFSDSGGATSPTRSPATPYGPYLKKVPALTVGTRAGRSGIAAADGPTVGWIYEASTGALRANTDTDADDRGRLYSDY